MFNYSNSNGASRGRKKSLWWLCFPRASDRKSKLWLLYAQLDSVSYTNISWTFNLYILPKRVLIIALISIGQLLKKTLTDDYLIHGYYLLNLFSKNDLQGQTSLLYLLSPSFPIWRNVSPFFWRIMKAAGQDNTHITIMLSS